MQELLLDFCIVGWGSNNCRQLALFSREDGDTVTNGEAIIALKDKEITDISCGLYHCLALSRSKRVYCWGHNYYGQLGLDHFKSVMNTVEEIPFFKTKPAIQISASDEFSVVLCENGKLYAFGYNYYGQLGIGDTYNTKYPTEVKQFTDDKIVSIASGSNHTYALTASGDLFSFGQNQFGQLGLGEGIEVAYTGTKVQFNQFAADERIDFISASNGNRLCLVVTNLKRVFVFGSIYDLFSNNRYIKHNPTEILFFRGKNIISIITGYMHFLALSADGTLYAWGDNSRGQLGTQTDSESRTYLGCPMTENIPTPKQSVPKLNFEDVQQVMLPSKVTQIAAGYHFSLALLKSNHVYAWGSNSYGQLGISELKAFSTWKPKKVSFLKNSSRILKLQASGRQSFAFVCCKGNIPEGIWKRRLHYCDCTITTSNTMRKSRQMMIPNACKISSG